MAAVEVEVEVRREGREESVLEETPLLRDQSGPGKRYSSAEEAFDPALERVPVGVFHLILVCVCGWAIASDSVEIQCISFVTPQLSSNQSGSYDLELNKTEEGVLDAIIFLGMMVGGYIWGSLSDLIGRRSCLISSLSFNGLFAFCSAFSPNYPSFLLFRFLSGVGVGGSFPVVFSYFSEFFPRRLRGPYVIILAAFWILGSIFAALLAWLVIGQFSDSAHSRVGAMAMESWRIYIILCTFPSLSSALSLLLLPESPSFLFAKERLRKSGQVMRRIQLLNSCCQRSKGVWSEERWRDYLREQLALCVRDRERQRGRWGWLTELTRSTLALFSPALLRASIVMLNIWFMFSFGYYGLLLWFPEYFKYIENCNYERRHNCIINPLHTGHSCGASVTPCNQTTEGAGDDDIYLDSLYVALAGLPGTLLGILTVNILGAKAMLVFSLVVSGLSSLLIWVIPDQQKTEDVVVMLSATFSAVSIIGWNALDVISTSQLFPVHLRSTAFGVQAMLGRLGAITGNIAFGKLFGATPYLPILLVASVLIFAGISALFLPSPHREHIGCHRLRCVYLFCCRQCRSRLGRKLNLQ